MQPVAERGGSDQALLRLVRSLPRDEFDFHIALPGPSPLAEEFLLVAQARDVGQPDPGDGEGRAGVQRTERDGDEVSGRGEQDGAVEWLRGVVGRTTDRIHSQVRGQFPVVLTTGEYMHPQTQMQRDLRG